MLLIISNLETFFLISNEIMWVPKHSYITFLEKYKEKERERKFKKKEKQTDYQYT